MPETPPVGAIILAAGESRRMGQAKQLMMLGGRPLLLHAVDAAVQSRCRPLVVVLGSRAAAIRPALEGRDLTVAVNDSWKEGMGSSVRAGVTAALALAPDIVGLVIALADQPGIGPTHFSRLVEEHRRSGRSIVAAAQGEVTGPPVFFGQEHFAELQLLNGDEGARSLLRRHSGKVSTVPVGDLGDIDTPADFFSYAGTACR